MLEIPERVCYYIRQPRMHFAKRVKIVKKDFARKTLSYLTVVLIAAVMALNYQLFVFPNRFAPAGLNGIFTMIQHLFDFKFIYTSIILNVPLAILAYFLDSKARAMRSLVYTLAFSGFLMLLDNVDLSVFVYSTTSSTLLGPAVAGIITGFCGSIMLKMNACFGGTEFVASLIHRYKPNFNFFTTIFALNAVVAVASYFVYDYKIEPVLLCIIYSYASSAVRESTTRKNQSAVRCEIFTDQPKELGQALLDTLHHGVTLFHATGVYSGKEKTVLVCIVNKSQEAALTKVVTAFPGSFAAFSPVVNVVGNFKQLDSKGKPLVQILDSGKDSKPSAAQEPAVKS